MEIEFYGAAGEVTGSCHILRVGRYEVLIDCGLIQGGRDAPQRNQADFPFSPPRISAVFLTHAHLDHCGRLPLLVKRGFRGAIYASAACRDLLPILLRDAAYLSQRDAERANRHREPGEPIVQPLYTLADVETTLSLVRALRYDTSYAPFPGLSLMLRDAGHIMGSASLWLRCQENGRSRTLIFSGDLGPYDSPILLDPYRFESADLLVMESTYGDRMHRARDATLKELQEVIVTAAKMGGNVIIPAFAIGRSQEILYVLGRHFDAWQLQDWSIFLDSPMAIEASAVYWRHTDRHDEEARRFRSGFGAMPPLPNLKLCRSTDESIAINQHRARALIIAGSGMCTGGRVVHHLRHNLDRPECHVVIAGYQAPGTLGRALVDREPIVKIFGDMISVRAAVHTIGGFSAHGDQADLLRWYRNFADRPPVYLVHGEARAAQALQHELATLGASSQVARPGARWTFN